MAVFGFRCSNSDLACAILSGTKEQPEIVYINVIKFPKDYNEAELMHWLHQEVTKLFGQAECSIVGIKKAEVSAKRTNAIDIRIGCGAIISLAAAQVGCTTVHNKMAATLAKDLGVKGRAKYLKSLDTSPIKDFNSYPPKTQEALLTAWSCI